MPIYAGRILSALAVVFLLMDGAMKLFKPAFVVEATRRLGYPESTIVGIGVALLTCTALHIIARTALLGAILLTAYLGGAVASNVRAGTGWFNTLFPAAMVVVVWLGLWLREERLRHLVPLAR
jgi:DoxX-like family